LEAVRGDLITERSPLSVVQMIGTSNRHIRYQHILMTSLTLSGRTQLFPLGRHSQGRGRRFRFARMPLKDTQLSEREDREVKETRGGGVRKVAERRERKDRGVK
jgi:hypothetical protein